MSELDSNAEREEVLSAVESMEQLPEAEPVSAVELMPEAEPLPAAEPVPEAEPVPAEEPVPHPPSSRGLPAPSAWMRHRHEIAGLVTAFVAIVWFAVAVAMGAWVPGLVGAVFAGGAACIRAYAPSAAA